MNKSEKIRLLNEVEVLNGEYNTLWTELANVNTTIPNHSVGSCNDYMIELVKRMGEIRSAINTIQWICWNNTIGSPLNSPSTKLSMLRQVYGKKD